MKTNLEKPIEFFKNIESEKYHSKKLLDAIVTSFGFGIFFSFLAIVMIGNTTDPGAPFAIGLPSLLLWFMGLSSFLKRRKLKSLLGEIILSSKYLFAKEIADLSKLFEEKRRQLEEKRFLVDALPFEDKSKTAHLKRLREEESELDKIHERIETLKHAWEKEYNTPQVVAALNSLNGRSGKDLLYLVEEAETEVASLIEESQPETQGLLEAESVAHRLS